MYVSQKISILQKKALRFINFAPFNAHTEPFFKNCNILKFADIINVESCIFVNNCFNEKHEKFQIRFNHALI